MTLSHTSQSFELLARVRTSQQESQSLLQDVAMLRRVATAAGPEPPPPPPHVAYHTNTFSTHGRLSTPSTTRISAKETPDEHNNWDTKGIEGVAQLAADDLFRNIKVSPGVTLFHMYQSP